ncbi:outer envelope pore protein 21 chloroplastic [Tripterygium wilfordii]|uniref:Outer envelope pore protein 21 chloroplastic n=1 Tax=Tripterygium wilfordii TaxID=458696 RepID=A0A7J7D3P5_TRIWF|nr:outer envelope pore protein 21B, chloroplastic-like isoform X1 [Tripterygium wilfordii]KAF5740974.1 outer envelope pore protein 21 chloroplastic [Tripterygium wilfordii]
METSLRYGGDDKALRIHAKQKILIDSKTHLQLHGELDTKIGEATYLCAMIEHFYPEASANVGVGVKYGKREKLQYSVHGKTSYPVTSDGLLRFVVKGQCDVNKEFGERKSKVGAGFTWSILNFQKDQDLRLKIGYEAFDKRKSKGGPEFTWSIFNFQKDQDVRLKIGYEVFDKVPYMQIRENNWTLNGDMNGRWNLRYNL